MVDAVLPADAVEQDLDRWLGEAPREDLAVVGQDLARQAVRLQS